MKNLLAEYITKLDKFNPSEVKAVVDHTELGSFKKGTIVLKEGMVCHRCFFVVKGCLRQYRLVDGEEKTTAFFMEGQAAVLYASYIQQAPSKYYLECLEDSLLTTGTREQELALHRQYPQLEQLIHTLMFEDLTKAEVRMEMLNHYKPEERYQHLLAHHPQLLQRVAQHQLASYIGVTPESFSRIRKRIAEKSC